MRQLEPMVAARNLALLLASQKADELDHRMTGCAVVSARLASDGEYREGVGEAIDSALVNLSAPEGTTFADDSATKWKSDASGYPPEDAPTTARLASWSGRRRKPAPVATKPRTSTIPGTTEQTEALLAFSAADCGRNAIRTLHRPRAIPRARAWG
jgi:hypothetical protein